MDPEVIRRKCRELPTDVLLADLFLQADQYTPEALELYRKELGGRIDLDALVAEERERTGEESLAVQVRGFEQTGSTAPSRPNAKIVPYRGMLRFAAGGVGFVPAGVKTSIATLPLSLLGRLDQALFFCPRGDIGVFELRGAEWSMRARNNVSALAHLPPEHVDDVARWAEEAGIRVNRSPARTGLWETVKALFR